MGYETLDSQKRRRKMKYAFIGSLFLLSLSIAIMPFASKYQEKSPLIVVGTGLLFWIGLFGTILTAIWINRRRKSSLYFNQLYPKTKQLGVIHFFQNKNAIIVDIAMFIALLGLIITKFALRQIEVPFAFLALFVFLFGMHCMLNGICYKYLNYKVKRGNES